MDLRISPSSGVPIYLQLMEQIKHAIDMGAVRPGEQLPTIRSVAEELAMNPNTVARAYRELEREGVISVRHGSGAYIEETATPAKRNAIRQTGEIFRKAIEKSKMLGLSEPELRRVFENEVAALDVETGPVRRRE
jgi:GntR family transcriptional regulator